MIDKPFLRSEMTQTYLIQRLKAPTCFDNPFSFGGGLVHGGLSDKAFKMLSGIFSFDYMGAAEFEWGAVPGAIQFLAEQIPVEKPKGLKGIFTKTEERGGLVTGEVVLDGKSRAKGYLEVKGKSLYYICPTSYEAEVRKRIETLAVDDYAIRLKMGAGVHSSLMGEKWGCEGWLEIDNGFFFFKNKEMFEKTKMLFGIE